MDTRIEHVRTYVMFRVLCFERFEHVLLPKRFNIYLGTASEVLDKIDDIWTEFGFSIRDGVLHRRRNAKSPNLVRSKWPTDADEEVLALWRRARPQVLGTLRDHYNSLIDVPVLTTDDEELISHMLRTDGAKLNDLARS